VFGPLPEASADPVLTRMLAPAPYQLSAKEDKTGSGRTKEVLHPEDILEAVSGEMKIPSPEGKSKGEANIHSPYGKKRVVSEEWEGGAPKRGKMPLSGGSGLEDNVIALTPDEDKPKS